MQRANPLAIDPGESNNNAAETLDYPSIDPGFPTLGLDRILDSNRDLLDRIKICYGVDRQSFDRDVLSLVRRYAAYVHLLPATAGNYFEAPGGLLRMGLEVAFFALQGTDAHIFSGRASITARRDLEPRWRHATFIAGLCCEIHRTLSHVIVTNEAGEEWQPYLLPLAAWLDGAKVDRYFLKWRSHAQESRALGVFALPHVVSPHVMQDLAAGNSIIVPHMLATISGMPAYREHNVLDGLVRRSVALVIDRYLQASADRYGKPQIGAHLERYLVDALRRLVAANAGWTVNAEKSRVWFAEDGMFLAWPSAAADVRKLLEADQLPGIPKAPETILEILQASGVLQPQDSGATTWTIHPPGSKTPIEAVKLTSPNILFAGTEDAPTALACSLLTPSSQATEQSGTGDPGKARKGAPPARTAPLAEQLPLPAIPAAAHHADGTRTSTTEAAATSGPFHEGTSTPPPDPRDPPTRLPSSVAPSPPIPVPVPLSLKAPLRLTRSVKDALQSIITTLNPQEGPAAACPMATGMFIPLSELARRNVEPSLALRALVELQMLVISGPLGTPSTSHEFNGEPVPGLVLHPRHVNGLIPLSTHCEPRQGR